MKIRNNRKIQKKYREHMADDENAELPKDSGELPPGTPVTSKEWKSIWTLLGVCLVLVIISFCAAFFTRKDTEGVGAYLGFSGTSATWGGVLVGLVSSTIFGLIDNGGLYFGMSSLDPIFRSYSMDSLMSAGWGNTFSDFLGAFLGTFIGKFVQNITGIENTALWAEVIGIVLGCILGIYIPKWFTEHEINVDFDVDVSAKKRKKKSD